MNANMGSTCKTISRICKIRSRPAKMKESKKLDVMEILSCIRKKAGICAADLRAHVLKALGKWKPAGSDARAIMIHSYIS
jgi:hypothetical protein